MSLPLVTCTSNQLSSWLFASVVGVLILIVETGVLAAAARRQGWPALVTLAVAAIASVGLTVSLSRMLTQERGALAAIACGTNGAWQVTLGNATSVLDAYTTVAVVFGAIIALVVFGTVVTLVSMVARKGAQRE